MDFKEKMKLNIFNASSKKQKCIILLILFCIAFPLRLCSVLKFPQFAWDSGKYVSLAHNILHHQDFKFGQGVKENPVDNRAPLYPAFIALISYFSNESHIPCEDQDSIISDKSLKWVRIIQALIDAITCLFIFWIALLLFESTFVALIAGIIASLHPSLIGPTTFILSETVSVFLLTLSMWILIYAMKKNKYKHFFLSGIVMGLATLCRPVTLPYPFLLFCIFTLFYFKQKNKLTGLSIFVVCFLLTLLPWVVRNAKEFKTFIPVSSNLGGNLWIGSYEPWGGTYNPEIIKIRKEIELKYYKGKIGHFHVDNHLKRDAWERIKKDPLTYIKLLPKKLWHFWGRIPGEIEVLKGLPIIKIIIYIFHYGLLLLFIWSLIIIIIKHSFQTLFIIPLSIIGYFTLIHILLVPLPRYRIPVIPMVIIFSAYGTYSLSEIIIAWFRRDKASNTSAAL